MKEGGGGKRQSVLRWPGWPKVYLMNTAWSSNVTFNLKRNSTHTFRIHFHDIFMTFSWHIHIHVSSINEVKWIYQMEGWTSKWSLSDSLYASTITPLNRNIYYRGQSTFPSSLGLATWIWMEEKTRWLPHDEGMSSDTSRRAQWWSLHSSIPIVHL